MRKKIIRIILTGFICCILPIVCGMSCAYADDIKFEVTMDDEVVSLGSMTRLNLNFYGTQDIMAPELPEIEGFKTIYVGPSSSVSIINRQVTLSITHAYTIIPLEIGLFTIGPFTYEHEGAEYTSAPIKIEVIEGPVVSRRRRSTASQRQSPSREYEDLSGRIYLTMEVPRGTVYVNEMIPMTIKLYVNRIGLKNIQYPNIPHEGFSIGKYDQPRQYREKDYNDNTFDVIEFKTTLFGTRSGKFELGPAELSASRIIRRGQRGFRSMDSFYEDNFFNNFFERYETHPIKLNSRPISMTVLRFPREGRPKSFNGTIGSFGFDLEADPRDVNIGDPITLTMKITGNGNFNTVTAPVFESHKGFKIYDPTVIEEKRGEKVFEQVIMPTTDSVTEIPKISFNFFNPERKIYQVISRGLIPIEVAKSEKADELRIVEFSKGIAQTFRKEKLGRDIIYIKESPGRLRDKGNFLYRQKGYLFMHMIPVLLLAAISTTHRKNKRLKTDERYARRLSAPRKASAGLRAASKFLKLEKREEFYEAVFKTLQEYIGDKYHITSGGITADIIDETLKAKGLKEEVLERLRKIFSDCDMARYASSQFEVRQMENTYTDLRGIIDSIERHKA